MRRPIGVMPAFTAMGRKEIVIASEVIFDIGPATTGPGIMRSAAGSLRRNGIVTRGCRHLVKLRSLRLG